MLDLHNCLTVVLIIILFVLLFGKKCHELFTMTNVISNIDNNGYKVAAKYEDKQQAADLIADMNLFALKLIERLKYVYIDTPTPEFKQTEEYQRGYMITYALLNRFNPKAVMENDAVSADITSYTTNKGETINMCLREKKSGQNKLHDLGTLQFVFIHEMAHIATKEIDHVVDFWVNFKFLLEFCERQGLYKTKNYQKENFNYCGMEITYSPIEDQALPSYFKPGRK